MKKILIDLLGSDNGSSELLSGVLEATKKYSKDYIFVCFGDEKEIKTFFDKNKVDSSKYEVVNCDLAFTNDDNPMLLARGQFDSSSLVKSLKYLKENPDSLGLITAGSTGGVLVGTRFKLGLIGHIQTPALASVLKSYNNKPLLLLDCGANLSFNEEKYVEFAHMGNSFMQAYLSVNKPRIGLLNVGKEEHKGTELLKATYQMLKNDNLNFVGNIEGNDVFLDKADVVLCDGFSGNIILKCAEAVGMIAATIAKNNKHDETYKTLESLFSYTSSGGALILGANKIIYKAHGSAKAETIVNICESLATLDKTNYLDIIKNEFEHIYNK